MRRREQNEIEMQCQCREIHIILDVENARFSIV